MCDKLSALTKKKEKKYVVENTWQFTTAYGAALVYHWLVYLGIPLRCVLRWVLNWARLSCQCTALPLYS